MERYELHNKIVQQLRFHRISGLDEEQCADNILSIVQTDWSDGCSCYEGEKIGETWCCNKCGKPTSKHTTHPTLPSDEVEFALKLNKYIHDQCIDGTPHDIGWNVMKMFSARMAQMDRRSLEALVKGSSPNYKHFSHPLVKKAGHSYSDQYGLTRWGSLSDLTNQELYDLHILCRDSWN